MNKCYNYIEIPLPEGTEVSSVELRAGRLRVYLKKDEPEWKIIKLQTIEE